MKCPFCGVNYTDGERECPVCGKRVRPFTPKKKSKFTNTGVDMPYQPEKKKKTPSSPKETADTTKNSNWAAWQKAAAQSNGNPYIPHGQKRQTSGCSIGCLIVLIIMGIIVILAVIGALSSYNSVDMADTFSDNNAESSYIADDFYDDIYESCEVSDVLAGIWVMGDTGLTLVVQTDGTVMWTDDTETAEDEYPFCERLLLDDSTADAYCTDEELERFPIDQYTHYTLYATDLADKLGNIDLYFYLPKDQEPYSLNSFECYDCNTEEYYTCTRTDGEVPAEPVPQTA